MIGHQLMNSVQYHKSLYIGTEKVTLGSIEETVLFDDDSILAYASLITTLTGIFWKAAFEYQQKIRPWPKHVGIFVPSAHLNGIRSQDHFKNTTLETLEWFLNNLVEPPGGIIISIYSYENLYPGLNNPYNGWSIWPLKRKWVGDGDYVTVQKMAKYSKGANGTSKKITAAKKIGHLDFIQNIEKYCPYLVKTIEYGDEESATELLVHSKRHFAYTGGSYYLAALVDTPTVCYGFPIHKEPWEGSIFNMNTEFKNRKSEKRRIRFEKGLHNWGSAHGQPSRIYHFDLKSNLCIQKPQTYVRHVWDKEELLGYITFTKDLDIMHRNRQDWLDLSDLPLFD
jgi:hypothetical protein